jgi:uncharacterized protein YukE
MSDPAMLRTQAARLRAAARAMRAGSAGLDDGLACVQRHYPAGPGGVWAGPAADTFHQRLGQARTGVREMQTAVERHAAECDRTAAALDTRARDVELERQRERERERARADR